MRGRRPSGPEYVDGLTGSCLAKERLKVVLETLAGTMRVQDACCRLNISEPRFYQLRLRVLEAALDRLEPRPVGRPARTLSPVEQEISALQEQLAAARDHLRAAQAREELALALPRLRRQPEAAEKKTSRRRPP